MRHRRARLSRFLSYGRTVRDSAEGAPTVRAGCDESTGDHRIATLDVCFITRFVTISPCAPAFCHVQNLASYQSDPRRGDFRSIVHASDTHFAVNVSDAIKELSIKSTLALGLEFAGVDLIENDDGVF